MITSGSLTKTGRLDETQVQDFLAEDSHNGRFVAVNQNLRSGHDSGEYAMSLNSESTLKEGSANGDGYEEDDTTFYRKSLSIRKT